MTNLEKFHIFAILFTKFEFTNKLNKKKGEKEKMNEKEKRNKLIAGVLRKKEKKKCMPPH